MSQAKYQPGDFQLSDDEPEGNYQPGDFLLSDDNDELQENFQPADFELSDNDAPQTNSRRTDFQLPTTPPTDNLQVIDSHLSNGNQRPIFHPEDFQIDSDGAGDLESNNGTGISTEGFKPEDFYVSDEDESSRNRSEDVRVSEEHGESQGALGGKILLSENFILSSPNLGSNSGLVQKLRAGMDSTKAQLRLPHVTAEALREKYRSQYGADPQTTRRLTTFGIDDPPPSSNAGPSHLHTNAGSASAENSQIPPKQDFIVATRLLRARTRLVCQRLVNLQYRLGQNHNQVISILRELDVHIAGESSEMYGSLPQNVVNSPPRPW